MEQLVLKVLKFDLGSATPANFLERYVRAAGSDVRLNSLALV
jgi:hypothetical protein